MCDAKNVLHRVSIAVSRQTLRRRPVIRICLVGVYEIREISMANQWLYIKPICRTPQNGGFWSHAGTSKSSITGFSTQKPPKILGTPQINRWYMVHHGTWFALKYALAITLGVRHNIQQRKHSCQDSPAKKISLMTPDGKELAIFIVNQIYFRHEKNQPINS